MSCSCHICKNTNRWNSRDRLIAALHGSYSLPVALDIIRSLGNDMRHAIEEANESVDGAELVSSSEVGVPGREYTKEYWKFYSSSRDFYFVVEYFAGTLWSIEVGYPAFFDEDDPCDVCDDGGDVHGHEETTYVFFSRTEVGELFESIPEFRFSQLRKSLQLGGLICPFCYRPISMCLDHIEGRLRRTK